MKNGAESEENHKEIQQRNAFLVKMDAVANEIICIKRCTCLENCCSC